MIKLAIFDMDGVIFEGKNFWYDIHDIYGTKERGVEVTHQYINTDYEQLGKIVVGELWGGKHAKKYLSIVNKRRYHPYVFNVFDYLNSNNILTAIISSGPYDLALRAKKDLNIDFLFANSIEVENNIITGVFNVMVPDGEKIKVAKNLVNELQIDFTDVFCIGDSLSDKEMCNLMGLSVAYDSFYDELKESCDHILEYGELYKIPSIIDSYNKSN